MISLTDKPINKPSDIPKRIHAGGLCVFCILILSLYHVFTTGSTLMACFTALRTVFPPGVRISVATRGFVGGALAACGCLSMEWTILVGRAGKLWWLSLGMSILVGSKRHRTRQTRCLTTKCPASQSRIGQENRHFSGRWR